MQIKIALTTVAVSVALVGVFAVRWVRDRNQTYSLTLAAGDAQGEYYAFGQALAKLIEERDPTIQIDVVATEGSQQNLDLLEQDEAQLALIQGDEPLSPASRAIAFLFPEMFHLITRTDVGIDEPSDLEGKRIALMPQGSGSYRLFWPLSEHYGLQESDFETTLLPPPQAHKALEEGSVDALFRIVALGNPTVSQLLENENIRLVPIDQGDALQLFLPALEANQIPKGTYDGAVPIPAEDLSVVAVRSLLVVRSDSDRQIVNAIARSLFEARNDLVELNPQAATIRPPESIRSQGIAFHPGAIDYYTQHEPSFLRKYADSMTLMLSVTMLCISGLWQLRIWLQDRQKNRADLYNLEIVRLIAQVSNINELAELEALRRQLFKIFEKVVADLDKDRISQESFQSFTFPWEVAVSTIRHREFLLVNHLPADSPKPSSLSDTSASVFDT